MACIVYQYIDTTKTLYGLAKCAVNAFFITDVHDKGKSRTAGAPDFFRGRINRPWEVWVRLNSFGGDNDVGAVSRRTEGDCETNTTTCTSNKQSFRL
jgi:hypothetical protein